MIYSINIYIHDHNIELWISHMSHLESFTHLGYCYYSFKFKFSYIAKL